MNDQDKWLDKIRKLIANAEDDALTPQAREAFLNKANELMEKYKIEWAKVRQENGKFTADQIDIKMRSVSIPKSWELGNGWIRGILGNISALCFCEALAIGSEHLWIVGTVNDSEIAFLLFQRLVINLRREVNKAILVKQIARDVFDKKKFTAQFLKGCEVAIGCRVEQILAERQKSMLAIIPVTQQSVEEFVRSHFKISEAAPERIHTDDAFTQGFEVGNQIPIFNEISDGDEH